MMKVPRNVFLLIVMVFAFSLPSGPVAAQVSDDIVEATTGTWLIASEDGSLGCRVLLRKNKTIGGYGLEEQKPCGTPWHDEIYAWDFADSGIVLRDATRKSLIFFEEQEGGPWRTPEGVTPRIYFIPEPGAMERVPVAKDVQGAWLLTDKAGKTLCTLTLLDKPAPGIDDADAVELSKDCSASVRKTKASAWQINEIQLVIIGGEDWVYTLTAGPNGTFISDDNKYRLKRPSK